MKANEAKVGSIVVSLHTGWKFKILKGHTFLGLIRVKCLTTKKITAIDPHLKVTHEQREQVGKLPEERKAGPSEAG